MSNRGKIILQAQDCYAQFDGGKGADFARASIQAPKLEDWFEQWVRDVSMFLQYPRKQLQVDSTSAQNYALPSDFVGMVKFYFNQNGDGDYNELPFQNYLNIAAKYGVGWTSADAGVPEAYFFPDEDNYGLMYKPNADNQGVNYIVLEYHYFPAALQAGPTGDLTSPNFPVAYHDSGQYFIAAKAHEFLGNPQMHDRLMAIYGSKVGKRKDQENKKSKGALRFQWS